MILEDEAMLIETERLYIRRMTDADRELTKQIFAEGEFADEYKDNSEMYKLMEDSTWYEICRPDTINGMIFEKGTNEFCGRVCMQRSEDEHPELGIELLRSKQNQRIGPEVIAAFCNWFHKESGISSIRVRIAEANTHSRHVFEKLGAVYIGRCSNLFDETLAWVEANIPDFDREDFDKDAPLTFSLALPLQ